MSKNYIQRTEENMPCHSMVQGSWGMSEKEAREYIRTRFTGLVEEIKGEIPLYQGGVLEEGETQDFRNGRNAGLKEVRDLLDTITPNSETK